MSRITTTFAKLQEEGRKALIPYITAGFPFAAITPSLMHGMVEAGADVIELGVPFSDPMADGPTIQKAGDRAIANGVGLVQVLAYVREFRQKNQTDRKSTRLNSSHQIISYAVFCLKKKKISRATPHAAVRRNLAPRPAT